MNLIAQLFHYYLYPGVVRCILCEVIFDYSVEISSISSIVLSSNSDQGQRKIPRGVIAEKKALTGFAPPT